MTMDTLPAFDPLAVLNRRHQDLDPTRYSMKLAGSQYGLDVAFSRTLEIDTKRMAVRVPYADGRNRDGVGDLLEIGGIDLSRHVGNPVHLFDHGKHVQLPIGLVEDPATGLYTGELDPVNQMASDLVFFYQGKGLKTLTPVKHLEKGKEMGGFDSGSPRREEDHALFCEQLFDLLVQKFIRAGSIGYQVKHAKPLRADYQTGTPEGLHLLSVLKLESSSVVLPANGDTVRKMLAMPTVCGKPMSPYLVKSLTPYAPEKKAVVVGGYEAKGYSDVRVEKYKALNQEGPRFGEGSLKSLPEIRKKYQAVKSVRRRLKKSTPGSSLVYVRGKDLAQLQQEAEAKGLKTERLGSNGDLEKIKLTGDDGTIDTVAKMFGRVKALGGTKSTVRKFDWDAASRTERANWLLSADSYMVGAEAWMLSQHTWDALPADVRKKLEAARGVKTLNNQREVKHIADTGVKAVVVGGFETKGHFDEYGFKVGDRVYPLGWGPQSGDSFIDAKIVSISGDHVVVKTSEGETSHYKLSDLRPWPAAAKKPKSGKKPTGGGITSPKGDQENYFASCERDEQGHCKDLNLKGKVMSDTVKTKALDTDAGTTENDPSQEPYGAQVLRRLHEDASLLMKDYDSLLGPLEHEHVKGHLTSHLGNIEKHLTDTEKLWGKHYKDLPGLAGMEEGEGDLDEETKDLTEDELAGVVDDLEAEADDIEAKDMDTMDDAANPAGSDTGDDFPLDQIEADQEENPVKSLKNTRKKYAPVRATKTLLTHKKAACVGCNKPDCSCQKRLPRKQKSLCEKCGSDPCSCQGQVGSKIAPLMAAGLGYAAGQILGGKDLDKVKEGGGYLNDLAQPDSAFGDEDRMKSYHYHKTFEGMVSLDEVHQDLADGENKVPPADFKPGAGAKGVKALSDDIHVAAGFTPDFKRECDKVGVIYTFVRWDKTEQVFTISGPDSAVRKIKKAFEYRSGNKSTSPVRTKGVDGGVHTDDDGYQVLDENGDPVEASKSSHKSCLMGASKFFKELSATRDFGDPHRSRAAQHAKDLDDLVNSGAEAEEEVPTETEPTPEEDMEPGAMGEKHLLAIKKSYEEQNQQMNGLLETLNKLNGRLVSA